MSTHPTQQPTNPLAKAASAYLRSAMHQPTHWYEWSPEAFAEADLQGKPILLDIGAVWCHWCHVMDRESYESDETAAIINEHFIAVKVDRDERPEVDARYQSAVSALTGQGGWPLTVFLTCEGKIFFGGTYFPPEDAYGRAGFKRVLLSIAEAYRERRDELERESDSLMEQLAAMESLQGHGGTFTPTVIQARDDRGRERSAVALQRLHRRELLHQRIAFALKLVAALAVCLGYREQNTLEAGAPISILGREVGAAEKDFSFAGEKDRQRPATLSGRGRHRRLVARGHLRPLVAGYLHRGEVLVDACGGLVRFVRFAVHHVATVATHRANVEQDRLALEIGLGECLRAPLVPVGRLMHGGPQIGGGRLGERVGRLLGRVRTHDRSVYAHDRCGDSVFCPV